MAAGGLLTLGATAAYVYVSDRQRREADAKYQEALALHKKAKAKGKKEPLLEAGILFQAAADMGSAAAQRTLGWHHRHGIGVKRDFKEAARRYQQAVDQGDAQAQYELAVLYMSGLGVEYNPKEAKRLAELASSQGYEAASNAMSGTDPRMEAGMKAAADESRGTLICRILCFSCL